MEPDMTNFLKLHMISTSRLIAAVLIGSSLFGCATVKMPPPTAKASTVEQIRAANLAPATAGGFTLAAGKNPDLDHSLSGLRGSSLTAGSGSFSQQLKEELLVELKAAGIYDENSKIVIGAQLTDSMIDAAIGTGKGRLAARFTVDRTGKRLFDKEVAVSATWESSFVGAVAIPAAINQYGALYQSLIAKLFEDAEFRAALVR
jgi:hypothetical protein